MKSDIVPEEHLNLVYLVANKMGFTPNHELYDDLISEGRIGLLRATDYDEDRGYEFSTHAVPRIRGAMYDWLRRNGILSRREKAVRKLIKRRRKEIEGRKGEGVSEAEVIDLLVNERKISERVVRGIGRRVVSIDDRVKEGSDLTLKDIILGNNSYSGDFGWDAEDFFFTAKAVCNKKEYVALVLYTEDSALERLPQEKIGKLLDVTKSRVCQMLRSAKEKLTKEYREKRLEKPTSLVLNLSNEVSREVAFIRVIGHCEIEGRQDYETFAQEAYGTPFNTFCYKIYLE